MERKVVKFFNDPGFGFKVKILNAPMVKLRGEWVLDLDQNKLQISLLEALAHKPFRLTGNEIRFIRNYFELTLKGLGERFDISHVAVLKWEKSGNRGTDMNWPTEKDIRLFIISKIQKKPEMLLLIYRELEAVIQTTKMIPVEVDAKKVA